MIARPAAASGRPSSAELYDRAPCGQLATDPAGVVVSVNSTFLDWTGYRRDQVVGSPLTRLLPAGSSLFYQTRCLPILRLEGSVREVSLTVSLPDGGSLPVLLNATTLPAKDGDPEVTLVAVFDVTTRHGYERELLAACRTAEGSELRVRVLQQASATFGSARTEESLVAALEETARAALDAARSSVLLLDPATGTLPSSAGVLNPLNAPAYAVGPRPEAEALRLGDVVAVTDLDDAERRFPVVAAALEDARLEALTATPMYGDDGPLGVLLCLFGRRRDPHEHETDLQRALARQGAQSLQRIRLQKRLQHMALHDGLTGLANRELLLNRLSQAHVATIDSRRPMAVLFLDLDGFKAINDLLGHAVGDAVLTRTAQRLRSVVRDGDTVARYGGDEFVIVCEDLAADAAVELAERALTAVREPLPGVPPSLPLTASIGVARCLHACDLPDPDAVMLAADEAMYRAKRGGKDRQVVIDV